MKRAGYLVVLALALLGAMALKGSLLVLPSPPATESATGFDANRAVARLQRILGDQRPHPVDSAEGDAVRARLIAEMRAVGLTPRITDDFICNGRRGSAVSCARVRNLVATIGPAEGKHLLLVSHYDSTPTGPGASDDGIGVASMLEVAHVLRGQRLSRPVTFLFDEGEEAGLIGARAFLERDPLASRVTTAVNVESRGVNGPAIMFETSRPNGPAIGLYRAAVARPVANSLSTDLYGLIPNSTDVAVLDERPWTILNFAVIGNETRYHSAGDDLASLDRRSVQHMGDQLEQVTREATRQETQNRSRTAAAGEWLYADLAGQMLIMLPLSVGLVLLGLLFLSSVMENVRQRAFGRPLLAMVAAFALAGILAFAGHLILGLIRAGDYWRAYPLVATTAVYASALAACVVALLLVAGTAERAKLRAAFWLFFTALGGGLCFVAPGAAIYFLLPPLVMGLGIAGRRWHPKAETIGAIAAAVLLYVTFGPAVALFEELMSSGPIWIFAPLGAIIMLPILIELRPVLSTLRALFVVAGAVDLAILAWIIAGFTPAYSADKQQLFTIEYVWDQAANSARYAVNNDGAAVPFAADWQRTEFPYTTRLRWAAPAPPAGIVPPTATLVSRQAYQGNLLIRVRLAAAGAESISLIAPEHARLKAAGVDGRLQPFADGTGRTVVRCAGRSCDGTIVDLVLSRPDSTTFTLVGTRAGLPPQADALVRARPALARAQYGPDSTIAIGSFRFDNAAHIVPTPPPLLVP
jgi:Peptidase family M28